MDLGVKHRAKAALRELMRRGADTTDALRRGLNSPNPRVREGCCIVLDHHLDALAVPELVANLDHEDARVRRWAMHALACDRCKEGECRPGEDDSIPLAMRALFEDPEYHVRKEAAALLGPSAHSRPEVIDALRRAHAQDPHPLVRKVSGWHIPGGPIFERTAPRRTRMSD
jgi:HEAT repeat protein